jgi:multiple sugar transport system permease protein
MNKGRRRAARGRAALVFKYLLLAVIASAMFLPFFWLVSASLQTYSEIISIPLTWLPSSPQWSNYREVLFNPNVKLRLYFTNSTIVSTAITAAVLLTSSLAGYALAKLRFPGRDFFFTFTLSTMMFPTFIFLIPVYYILKRFPLLGGNDLLGQGGAGALSSHLGLILPFVVSAWGIFLMRQFMMGIPDDFLDAARIDGASEFRIFSTVVAPLVKPAFVTLGIFQFIGSWNSFLWPLIVTTSAPELMTLPVGLRMMVTAYSTTTVQNRLFAATVLGIVPTIVIFLALQRHYVKGIALTGIK